MLEPHSQMVSNSRLDEYIHLESASNVQALCELETMSLFYIKLNCMELSQGDGGLLYKEATYRQFTVTARLFNRNTDTLPLGQLWHFYFDSE